MVASVFILKEKMRGTQVIGALMLLSGLVMFFNTSLIEIFTRLTDYTGRYFWRRRGDGVGELWRGAKSIIATSGLAADPVFTVHFMYDSALAAGKTDGDSATERLAARLFDFLRAKYAGRIWRPAEAMARWQAAQVSAIITLTPLFTLLFSDLLSMARPISSPDRC